MSKKHFDFDQFMEERNEEKFTVTAFGEVHELPNDIPFDIMLKIARAHKSGQKAFSDEETLEFSNVIFGEETFNKFLKKGIGLKGVIVLTEKVMEMYMDKGQTESAEMANDKGNTP